MEGKKRKRGEPHDEDRITLNVGGTFFETTRGTLIRNPETMLGSMFGGGIGKRADKDGSYFFDRSPKLFEHVMDYLRTGYLPSGSELGFNEQMDGAWKKELEYWGISYTYDDVPEGVCLGKELEDVAISAFQRLFDDFVASEEYKNHVKADRKNDFIWVFAKGYPITTKDGELDAYSLIHSWIKSFKEYAATQHRLRVTTGISLKDSIQGPVRDHMFHMRWPTNPRMNVVKDMKNKKINPVIRWIEFSVLSDSEMKKLALAREDGKKTEEDNPKKVKDKPKMTKDIDSNSSSDDSSSSDSEDEGASLKYDTDRDFKLSDLLASENVEREIAK